MAGHRRWWGAGALVLALSGAARADGAATETVAKLEQAARLAMEAGERVRS